MRVWEAGEGPSLLAVHGLGGSGRYFQGVADALGEHYRIVAPDLAGFGASGKPDRAAYDRAFHLANLEAALEGATEHVVVVGHSIGGVLAALWAGANAERVPALVLAATPYPSGDGAYPWMQEGRLPTRHVVMERAMRVLVPTLSLPIGMARGYPATVAFDYGRQKLLGRARTMWWALHDPGVRTELDRVGMKLAGTPILLMHARDDRTVHVDAIERWAELFPAAQQRITDDGGHQFLLRTGVPPLATWLDARLPG